MAVPAQKPIVIYTVNGSTNRFAITFDLHDSRYLDVLLNKELVPVSSYKIENNNEIIINLPLIEGDEVILSRSTTLERPTKFNSYDNSFRPEALNWDLDKIWHTLQEQYLIDAQFLSRLKNEIVTRRTSDSLLQHQIDILNDVLIGVFEKASNEYLESKLKQLDIAINVALSAGAGAAGWTDKLIQTWSGVNQDQKNQEVLSLHDYCVCDGVTDDTANFKKIAKDALTSGKKIIAYSGKLNISEHISLRYLNFDLGSIEIILNGCTLHIGHKAGSAITKEQKLGVVRQAGSFILNPQVLVTPSVQVWGSKCTRFTFDQIDYMKLWASTDPITYPHDASIAYCYFYGNLLTRLDFATDPRFAEGMQADGAGSANQWINSNYFHIARVMGVTIDGSYRHNANIFYNPTFENSSGSTTSYIHILCGNKNIFEGIRGENYPEIKFGEKTSGNLIERIWYSAQSNILDHKNVTDLGLLNKYTTRQVEQATFIPLIDLDSRYGPLMNGQIGNYAARQVTRKFIRGVASSRIIYQTEIFDIIGKDILFFECNSIDSTVSRYQIRVYLYDENNELITDFDSTMFSGANFNATYAASGFLFGSFNSIGRAWLNLTNGLDKRVKKVSLMLLNYSDYEQSRSTKINVFLMTMREKFSLLQTKVHPYFTYNFVADKPSAYIGRIGDIIPSTTDTNFKCTFALNTKLAVAMNTDTATISMTSTSISAVGGIKPNDLVGIDLDNGDTHWTNIATISGGITTLSSPVLSTASLGNNVYVSRIV